MCRDFLLPPMGIPSCNSPSGKTIVEEVGVWSVTFDRRFSKKKTAKPRLQTGGRNGDGIIVNYGCTLTNN